MNIIPDPEHYVHRFCAKTGCDREIGAEFVLQISTRHVRWFCGMECTVESWEQHLTELLQP